MWSKQMQADRFPGSLNPKRNKDQKAPAGLGLLTGCHHAQGVVRAALASRLQLWLHHHGIRRKRQPNLYGDPAWLIEFLLVAIPIEDFALGIKNAVGV